MLPRRKKKEKERKHMILYPNRDNGFLSKEKIYMYIYTLIYKMSSENDCAHC